MPKTERIVLERPEWVSTILVTTNENDHSDSAAGETAETESERPETA